MDMKINTSQDSFGLSRVVVFGLVEVNGVFLAKEHAYLNEY
jgi:hypothetical protein